MVELRKVVDAAAEIEEEPYDNNWCKTTGDFGCAKRLNCEEEDKDCAGYSDDGCYDINQSLRLV